MNSIKINGSFFSVSNSGNISISQNWNEIIINGKKVETSDKIINIEINWDLTSLDVDCCNNITTNNALNITTSSGNVNVKWKVTWRVRSTSGDIEVGGDIGGGAETVSWDVKINWDLKGNAKSISWNVIW